MSQVLGQAARVIGPLQWRFEKGCRGRTEYMGTEKGSRQIWGWKKAWSSSGLGRRELAAADNDLVTGGGVPGGWALA